MSAPAPNREAVLASLERLLAWSEMVRSQQLGRFLDYIVRRKLDGQEQSIKAYSIAVDVFGRGADFDPQSDPIVRVQARRLRRLLDEYYQGPGLGEQPQIRLPVGRYIPEFVVETVPEAEEGVEPPPVRRFPARLPLTWYILAIIALVTAMIAYATSKWGPDESATPPSAGTVLPPALRIMEFQDLSANNGSSPQVSGLAVELVTDLGQFGNIDVRYRGTENAASAPDPSDFVLTGIVRPNDDIVQYSAILTHSRSSGVVWNHSIAVPAAQAGSPDVLDSVSRSISLILGSPRGPLHAAAREMLASGPLQEGQINLYLCRTLFDLYRETGGAGEAERAESCFLGLPQSENETPQALAATASLLVEHGGLLAGLDAAPDDRVRIASTRLAQAMDLDPLNSFVWEQQARLHESQGLMALARAGYASAVQLNPANADALASFALMLALAGALDEAEPLARAAAEGSPGPPAWYHGVPALLALREQRFADAMEDAELYAQADRELGPILAIMAAQRAGEETLVNRYLPQVLDVPAFRSAGVLSRLRERITDPALVDSIRRSLTEAGVPAPALIRAF